MYKRARNKLADESDFQKSTAPSYFIECLLSNVDHDVIDTHNLQERFLGVLVDLTDEEKEWESFTAQHGLRELFGEQPEQWNPEDAVEFLTAIIDLWENWEDY
jgi:hypothetical protein